MPTKYLLQSWLLLVVISFIPLAGGALAEELLAEKPEILSATSEPGTSHTHQPDPGKKYTVRNITFGVRDIFDGEGLNSFYRTANSLKMTTSHDVLRREMLIKSGQVYDRFLVEESERALRNLRFVRNVEIFPTFEGEFVDLKVLVQDTWTLIPILNYSSGGGNTRQTIGVSDSNVAGLGKSLDFIYDKDGDKEEVEGVYRDPQLFGTRKSLTFAYADRSDGYLVSGSIGRPFRGLVDKESWKVAGLQGDTIGRLYANGDERFIFRQERMDFGGLYTITRGHPEDVALRYSAGYDFEDADFSQADAEDFEDADVDPNDVIDDPSLLADDRRLSGPFLAFERIEAGFIKRNYVDRFSLIEDFNLGNNFEAKLGYSSEAFGAIDNNLLISLNDSDGLELSGNAFLRGELGLGSRLNSDGFENTLFRAEGKYYNMLGPKYWREAYLGNHTIAGSMLLDFGDRLDRDREFLLGADTGLRGYEDNTFFGEKRFLMNLEERFHLFDDVAKLVSIGGAFFIDAGGTTEEGVEEIFKNEFYSDIGFGFRFAFPRSSGSRVLRADFAFPLRDGPDGSDTFEVRLILEGGNVTTATLRSERLGVESANTLLGKNN